MKKYIPSVRDLPKCKRTPVLAEADLSGKWIPPMQVYLVDDVDKAITSLEIEISRLRNANRLLQARDDYVTGCLV